MLEIDRLLSESGLPIQLILICGKNDRLLEELRARRRPGPRLIEGFTTNVPYYMQLADFLIGKPGPGSISEALAMGLPVIAERNAWTLPQERYNTEWVREKQVGLVVPNFSAVVGAVAEMLEGETFDRFRCNAKMMHNRALFEIPEILSRILEGSAN
jgi:1,2-diacylglycerol 3-beta-galactosyltransferase